MNDNAAAAQVHIGRRRCFLRCSVLLFKETGVVANLDTPKSFLSGGYFSMVYAVTVIAGRYHFPYPLIAMLASVTILAAYRRMQPSLVGERT